MANYWFTSDTHFWHKNIRVYCPDRPGGSMEEMIEILIARWNEVVGVNDFIYHLGDFSFGSRKKAISILERLNGRKHLIRGNHDYHCKKEDFAKHWEWIKDYYMLTVQDHKHPHGKQPIALMHYPMLVWDRSHHGSWQLHGHSHSTLNYMNVDVKRLDVGVDGHDCYPWSYEEVKAHMAAKPIQKLDHHNEETNP